MQHLQTNRTAEVETAPCEGYQPPTALGVEAEVASFPALLPTLAFSSTLFETRYPKPVFSACVREGDTLVARFRTQPGLAHGTLLADLCRSMAEGTALLETDPYAAANRLTCWAKTSILIATPLSAGQDVDLYRAKETPQWSLMAARPATAQHGRRCAPFNIYVLDPVLADRLGQAVVRGNLSATLYR